jgi:hypothetical protein
MDDVKARKRLGIALSGGSSRAAALALGWMRALHQLKVTEKAGYLASNSGSSWFNAPFSFQTSYPVEKFLGPYIPPQELSLAVIDETNIGTSGSFASVVSKAEVIRGGLLGKTGSSLHSEVLRLLRLPHNFHSHMLCLPFICHQPIISDLL